MLDNYHHKFVGDGRLIFVPTNSARTFGSQLHKKILQRRSPPANFYHHHDGGHVAAAQVHLVSHFFIRLDLARFFDSITRSKVHRSLRRIGFKQGYAWEAACACTVSKTNTKKSFSLPFGFVQSPILASIALSTSAPGAALSKVRSTGVMLSVYVDDIILSGNDEGDPIAARRLLETAAAISGLKFNPLKCSGPATTIEVFNLIMSNNMIEVNPTRFSAFESTVKIADDSTVGGIIGYVGTVQH